MYCGIVTTMFAQFKYKNFANNYYNHKNNVCKLYVYMIIIIPLVDLWFYEINGVGIDPKKKIFMLHNNNK